jgi:hypothetical protein
MPGVLHRILAMMQHSSVTTELMRGANIVRGQGLEAEDRDAVAHEIEVLHVARDIVRYGGETGQREAGVEI